jgi:hypothetical protein
VLHSARETSKLAIDLRLRDNQEVIDLIVNMADRLIEDPKTRQKIKSLARRSLARSTLGQLAQYRREGAKLTEVLPLIWQWRNKLKDVGMGHIFRAAMILMILVVPVRMGEWSRRFRRSYRRD